ncbi:MAG TPA: S8 family serine peptidase [Thermoanaerobaculia bacterium]
MARSSLRFVLVLVSLFVVPLLFADGVLIQCARPCTKEIAAVKKAGGSITYEYQYVDGIAADVPAGAIAGLEKIVGADRIGKDEMIPNPSPVIDRDAAGEAVVEADAVVELASEEGLTVEPANYPFNAQQTGVATLHSTGKIGTGGIIAIIDSGYRPMFNHVAASRVIAPGFNFVPGATEPPAISNSNGAHGTQVAGMAAANIGFCFSTANRFARTALDLGLVSQGPCAAGSVLVPMVGGAPGARIVPFKVFPAAGGGSPTSRTIAAMEKVLDLRLKFNAGDPAGLNIRVVNLSLGGPTSAAGRTLSDQTVDKLLANDILPVISAGNSGHSGVTGGSPGTSMSALTVGATASANHEWIYTAQFRAPCSSTPLASVTACAQRYRPYAATQMASFSSRGPTHDGRVRPDIVANGAFDYTQGGGSTATTVGFVSGTSFSSPTTAGIAATLRQAVPTATARQVRNALIMTANPNVVPTAKPNDQGAGFVDAAAAYALLLAGNVPDTVDLSSHYTRNLQANMARAGVPVHDGGAAVSFTGIRPSETAEVPVLVPDNTEKLYIRIRNIVAANPPASQNLFFGDDVHLKIQKNTVHNEDYFEFAPLVTSAFLKAGLEYNYSVTRPAAGVWRITPTGDWTNNGTVSFDVDVWIEQESWPNKTASSSLAHLEQHAYQLVVPAGTAALNVRAEWLNMAGHYPINDVDVILVSPSNTNNFACATSRTPELCSVANPAAGTWTAIVQGFAVSAFGTPGGKEKYTLRVEADGTVLKPVN